MKIMNRKMGIGRHNIQELMEPQWWTQHQIKINLQVVGEFCAELFKSIQDLHMIRRHSRN